MLKPFQINAIQAALREAGFHYFEPTGVWDQDTTHSYRQWHAVVLLHPDAHALEQPSSLTSVCAELLELAGLDVDDEDQDPDAADNDVEDPDDDSEPGEGEDPDGESDDEGGESTLPAEQVPAQGSVVISNGENAEVVDGNNPVDPNFQLDQNDLDAINGQQGQQGEQTGDENTDQEGGEQGEQKEAPADEVVETETNSDSNESADQDGGEQESGDSQQESGDSQQEAPAETETQSAPAVKLTAKQKRAKAAQEDAAKNA